MQSERLVSNVSGCRPSTLFAETVRTRADCSVQASVVTGPGAEALGTIGRPDVAFQPRALA